MDQRDLKPPTDYLGPDGRLPSDSNLTVGVESKLDSNLQASDQITLSSLDATDACQFERQVHSVALVDQLLSIMRITASNKESKVAELAELDSKVRSFLEVLMGEPRRSQRISCVPVALCIR